MASVPTRADAENLERLQALRPAFERLKAERIRAESEIDRLARELDTARREAEKELGTADEAEIERMIAEAHVLNTSLVDAFASTVRAIDERLAGLGARAVGENPAGLGGGA